MSAPQNFRSAFNGFNKEDVVQYLEYINAKHTSHINQLTAENEELRAQTENQPSARLLASVQAQCAALTAQLEEAEARCQALEAQLQESQEQCRNLEQQLAEAEAVPAEPQQVPVPVPVPVAEVRPVTSVSDELETYRRAERIEREARERAELVYFQANAVLTEATSKVDGITSEITDMADQVMTQLTQLQVAVSSSKRALQDAVSIMNAIRPNK